MKFGKKALQEPIHAITEFEGHKITPAEFQLWTDVEINGMPKMKAVEKYRGSSMPNLTLNRLTKYRKSPWWHELCDTTIRDAQKQLHMGLMSKTDKMLGFSDRLFDGELANDKSVGAAVNLIQTAAKMGATPLIDTNNNINVNTQINNNVTHYEVNHDKLRAEASEEVILEVLTGGPCPEEYRLVQRDE